MKSDETGRDDGGKFAKAKVSEQAGDHAKVVAAAAAYRRQSEADAEAGSARRQGPAATKRAATSNAEALKQAVTKKQGK